MTVRAAAGLLLALVAMPAAAAAATPGALESEGGCLPESSPYLVQDSSLLGARISYCAGGDAWTGTLRLRVPAATLEDHVIVVAGYPGHPGVTLTLRHADGQAEVLAVPPVGDVWRTLTIAQVGLDADGDVVVEVEDRSAETFGWAGLGLAPRQAVPATYPGIGVAAAVLFLVLLVSTWSRRPGFAAISSPANAPAVAAVLGLLTGLALLFRRPSQFHHPHLWAEEGVVSLPGFLANGPGFLFEPVAGYLTLPSRLLFYLATFAPPESFPAALLVLAALFTWVVVCAIALCPSHLHAPVPVAAFLLLLPTDAENYATAHYAFWFGAALLLPAMFWKDDGRPRRWLRSTLVVVGGLSSPLVIALLPVFIARLVLFRNRNEALQAGLATATAAIQAGFLASAAHGSAPAVTLNSPGLLVSKFFGLFWAPVDMLALPFGLLLLAFVVAFVARRAGQADPWPAFAAYGLAATIVISVARAPLEVIHPVVAGPRYFFFPYLFLGLLVIESGTWSRRMAAACLVVFVFCMVRFVDVGSRTHGPLDWATHLQACARGGGDYPFPIHTDGDATRAWRVTLSGDECRSILAGWR